MTNQNSSVRTTAKTTYDARRWRHLSASASTWPRRCRPSSMSKTFRPWQLCLSLAWLHLFALPLYAGNFYLSSERIFAPGQQARVKLETAGVPELEIRVYRLEDPRAWFNQQRDLHRPLEHAAKPTLGTLSLLQLGAKEQLGKLLRDVRLQFGADGRQLLKKSFQSVHAAAAPAPRARTPEKHVPILKTHPLLDSWRHPLPKRNGWIYDEIALPFSEPGAFLVEATDHDQIAYAVVLVSDVSIVTKQSDEELLVWTVHPGTGEPVSDVDVEVLLNGQMKAKGRSDGRGITRFPLENANHTVIYAQQGNSFSLLDPQFFPAILPEPRTYLFTERPMYRPGQAVFWKGFSRDMDGERYVLPAHGGAAADATVTVQAIDPEGKVWQQSDVTMSDRGSFDGKFTLPDEPTMGTWQLVATVSGKRHAGQFKVMSYVKPEVKLEVRLHDRVLRAGAAVAGQVEGSYFFGAPFPNAEVKITATRTKWVIPWYVDAEYRWYYSEAEYENTRREVVFESTCKLNELGLCPFEFGTQAGDEDYTYVVEATALDPMGKTVVGSDSMQLTKGAFRLTVDVAKRIVEPGATQTLKIRAEDYERRPIETPVRLVVLGKRLAKDGLLESVEVARETLQTDRNGEVDWTLPTGRGGYYEVEVATEDGHGTTLRSSTFLFVSEDAQALPFSPDDIEIITDRKSYFAGDDALVLILTPAPSSHLLFTVEGGGLYRAEVLQAKGHTILTRVSIGERQTPNFYLSATTLVGDKIYTRNRNVVVPPADQLLTLEVSPDRPEARPGEKVTFRVHATDAKGVPAKDVEVALSVVDEAIYSLSSELAVPLEGFFYPRKRNNVRTYDSMSFRFFGASKSLTQKTASRMGPARHAFGSMKMQNGDVRRNFQDTAAFLPSLLTDENGDARATIQLPDNLTSWRATARAMSRSTQVGFGKGHVRAKKDLMVKVALPAALQQGDRGIGKIWVQNLTRQPLDVDLQLVVREAETNPTGSHHQPKKTAPLPRFSLQLADEAKRVRLEPQKSMDVPFAWSALQAGDVSLRAKAQSGAHEDELEKRFEITEWARPVRASASGVNGPGNTTSRHLLKLPAASRLEDATLQIDVVANQIAAIRGALPYLVDYPWGCTEQTMSRFVPALAAQEVFSRLGLQMANAAAKRERALSMGLSRVWQLQHEDGGWGWWEQDETDLWMSAYVLDGLAQAKALGLAVEDAPLQKGAEAMERLLAKPAVSDDVLAFAVYALAQLQRPQNAITAALSEKARQGKLSAGAMAYLVETLSALGRSPEAKDIASRLAAQARQQDERAWWGGPLAFADSWSAQDFPSVHASEHPVEITALALRALDRVGGYDALASSAERWLLLQYDDNRFGTTRQSALVIRALALRVQDKPTGSSELTIRVEGAEVMRWQAKSAAELLEPIQLRPALQLDRREIVVEVEATGTLSLVHTIALLGVSREDILPATQQGLRVERSFTRLSGATGTWQAGQQALAYKTGEPVLVSLTIHSPDEVEHVMLEDFRPATLFPIENDQGVQLDGIRLFSRNFRREHRDDRTAFFFTRLSRGTTTVHYLARTGLPGEFRALPARAVAMYQPARFEGQSASTILRVSEN